MWHRLRIGVRVLSLLETRCAQRGLRKATARFLFNSVQLDFYLRRNLAAVTCLVLLLSAGKDRIADAAKSKAVLERGLKPGLLKEIVYAEAQHTLEFEEGCLFVEDIVGIMR